MPTTSVTRPAGSGAGSNWTNLNNISASDNNYAYYEIRGTADLDPLIAYNFGFNIPSNASINGISVSIEASGSDSNYLFLDEVSLGTWNGNSFTTKGNTKQDIAYLTAADTVYSVGSSSDLWGASWSPSDFNSSQFGCIISIRNTQDAQITAYIDYVSITITYTAGTTYQLSASIPMITTLTPKVSIIKRIKSSIAGSTSFSGIVKRFAGLKASIGGSSVLSSFVSVYKRLVSVIVGATQISTFIAIQKALKSAIHSSTNFLSDLTIRGKQFLNAVISTGTNLVSNLKVQHTLASVLAGKTQMSPFVSVKKALQGSISGETLFVGTINRVKLLVSNITTQTILTAQIIVPKLLSALINGGTYFTGHIQRLRGLTSKFAGHTTIQAQLISSQLLQAVISSATHISAFLKKDTKMFASFIGSTVFVAVPTFWNIVKRPTATWQQKSEEVKTWKRIK
jgi:hypothetical protein